MIADVSMTTPRQYAFAAVTAVRSALAMYRAHPARDAAALERFEVRFAELQALDDRHAKGRATLAQVVLPARDLACAIDQANTVADIDHHLGDVPDKAEAIQKVVDSMSVTPRLPPVASR